MTQSDKYSCMTPPVPTWPVVTGPTLCCRPMTHPMSLVTGHLLCLSWLAVTRWYDTHTNCSSCSDMYQLGSQSSPHTTTTTSPREIHSSTQKCRWCLANPLDNPVFPMDSSLTTKPRLHNHMALACPCLIHPWPPSSHHGLSSMSATINQSPWLRNKLVYLHTRCYSFMVLNHQNFHTMGFPYIPMVMKLTPRELYTPLLMLFMSTWCHPSLCCPWRKYRWNFTKISEISPLSVRSDIFYRTKSILLPSSIGYVWITL
jgi:hypothetical protein